MQREGSPQNKVPNLVSNVLYLHYQIICNMQIIPTPLVRAICRVIAEKANATSHGYNMDCLISAEFTPGPSYEHLYPIAYKWVQRLGYQFWDLTYTLKQLWKKDHRYDNLWRDIYQSILSSWAEGLQLNSEPKPKRFLK